MMNFCNHFLLDFCELVKEICRVVVDYCMRIPSSQEPAVGEVRPLATTGREWTS